MHEEYVEEVKYYPEEEEYIDISNLDEITSKDEGLLLVIKRLVHIQRKKKKLKNTKSSISIVKVARIWSPRL